MMQYLGTDGNIASDYDLDDGEIGNIETIRSSSSVIFYYILFQSVFLREALYSR